MSNEEINRKIAEACGLRKTTECDDCYGTGYGGSECDHIPCDTCKTTGRVAPYFQNLPDYCSDLNAMHEAENALTDDERLDYIDNLLRIQSHEKSLPVALTFAPAQQRSEAFLKTVAPKL